MRAQRKKRGNRAAPMEEWGGLTHFQALQTTQSVCRHTVRGLPLLAQGDAPLKRAGPAVRLILDTVERVVGDRPQQQQLEAYLKRNSTRASKGTVSKFLSGQIDWPLDVPRKLVNYIFHGHKVGSGDVDACRATVSDFFFRNPEGEEFPAFFMQERRGWPAPWSPKEFAHLIDWLVAQVKLNEMHHRNDRFHITLFGNVPFVAASIAASFHEIDKSLAAAIRANIEVIWRVPKELAGVANERCRQFGINQRQRLTDVANRISVVDGCYWDQIPVFSFVHVVANARILGHQDDPLDQLFAIRPHAPDRFPLTIALSGEEREMCLERLLEPAAYSDFTRANVGIQVDENLGRARSTP